MLPARGTPPAHHWPTVRSRDVRQYAFARQMAFLVEADKLKNDFPGGRRCRTDPRRRIQPHSSHLALAALALHEYAPAGVCRARSRTGDGARSRGDRCRRHVCVQDAVAAEGKLDRERAAADRHSSGLLPINLRDRFRAASDVGRGAETVDSRFAGENALDRLQALPEHVVGRRQLDRASGEAHAGAEAREEQVRTALPDVWPFVVEILIAFPHQGKSRSG